MFRFVRYIRDWICWTVDGVRYRDELRRDIYAKTTFIDEHGPDWLERLRDRVRG